MPKIRYSPLLIPLILALLGCSGTSNYFQPSSAVHPPPITQTSTRTLSPTGTPTPTVDPNICFIVTPTPSSVTWFSKMCFAQGMEILSSTRVNDFALERAHYVVIWVFSGRPELLQDLLAENIRLVIYNDDTTTPGTPIESTSIPSLTAAIGGKTKGVFDPIAKLIVTWDDDLICNLEDKTSTEGWSQYTVHEIAHAVLHVEILSTPQNEDTPNFSETLTSAYASSEQDWIGVGTSEYWAESVTAYFGVYYNPDWIADSTVTRQISQGELQDYEPDVYNLIAHIFGPVQGDQPGCSTPTPTN